MRGEKDVAGYSQSFGRLVIRQCTMLSQDQEAGHALGLEVVCVYRSSRPWNNLEVIGMVPEAQNGGRYI